MLKAGKTNDLCERKILMKKTRTPVSLLLCTLLALLLLLMLLPLGTVSFAAEDPSNPSHEGRDCEWDTGRTITVPTCTTPGEVKFTCKIDALHTKTEAIPATNHDYEWTITENSSATAPGTATAVCKNNPSHTESMTIPARGVAVEVGYCGTGLNHAYYALYEDGTLLIFGAGAIKDSAFYYRSDVKRLLIDNGITAIGSSAFAFCRFESIDFGNTLETIGSLAFYDCDGFEEVLLPDSVKDVGDCAFGLSSNLKKVVFGRNVELVGDCSLLQCYELKQSVFLNRDTIIVEKEHPAPVQEGATPNLLRTINGGTVYGYTGGSVEAYANEKGLPFVALDAEGHAFDDGVVTTKPTCTEDGVETFTCAVCGDSYTALVAATGHDWSEWIVTRNPSETREGEAYRYCKNDPSHIEHKTIDKLPETNEEGGNIFQQILDWVQSFFDRIGEAFRNLFRF